MAIDQQKVLTNVQFARLLSALFLIIFMEVIEAIVRFSGVYLLLGLWLNQNSATVATSFILSCCYAAKYFLKDPVMFFAIKIAGFDGEIPSNKI